MDVWPVSSSAGAQREGATDRVQRSTVDSDVLYGWWQQQKEH